jgi:hypothetical protein
MMSSLMVVEKVFFEEIDGCAKPAFEGEAALLVRLLVPLPVVFLNKGLIARSAPVPWFSL